MPPKVVAIIFINKDYLPIKFLEIFVQFYFGFISRKKQAKKCWEVSGFHQPSNDLGMANDISFKFKKKDNPQTF